MLEGALQFLVRPRKVWTRARSAARIRQAVVSGERVRAGGREVLDIRSNRTPKCVGNLDCRIARNEVAADDIAGHLPASAQIDTVDVPANLVMLNQIALAYTQESQPEIAGSRGRRLGSSRTIAIKRVQPDPVVAAAGKSSSPAGGTLGANRVSYRSIPLDFAICNGSQEYAAETAIRDSNPADLYIALRRQEYPKTAEVAYEHRSKDRYIAGLNHIHAVVKRRGWCATGAGSRHGEAVQAQFDTPGSKCDARPTYNFAGHITHQFAVLGKSDCLGNGSVDFRLRGLGGPGTDHQRKNRDYETGKASPILHLSASITSAFQVCRAICLPEV